MNLYLAPSVSFRLGMPIPSSATLVKSYEPDVSEQLVALFHRLPQLEEPYRFFRHTYYAYQSWLDSISNILAVEIPSEDLFDRMELAPSSYLFAAKVAIDQLRSHYLLSGLSVAQINSRVAYYRKGSKRICVRRSFTSLRYAHRYSHL